MKQTAISVSVSFLLASLLGAWAYFYMPVDPLMVVGNGDLGAAIATINATDRISDSRAVINTNFANLNSDKIEVSTTTLPNITTLANLANVGTISSGTWNASTLSVAYGGTGSTTLLANGVLYGDGTNAVKAVPVGADDQVLTLVDGVPAWRSGSVDESLNYNWAGYHDFAHIGMVSATATAITMLATTTDFMGAINKGYVDQHRIASTSATLKISLDTSASTTQTSYTKMKEVTLLVYGSVSVWFSVERVAGTETNSCGKIYVNGVPIDSTEACTSLGKNTVAHTIYVAAGDTIQLYAKREGGTGTTVSDFRIYYDEITTDSSYIIRIN